MKISFLLLPIAALCLSSCQNMPWSRPAAADPYATGNYGAAPTGYPATAPADGGYSAPNYDVSGEQAQVYPANGAPVSNSADPTQYSSPSTTKTSSVKAAAPKTSAKKGAAAASAVASTSGKTYVVQKGDNLSKISKAKGTTVSKIMKANGLTTDTIRVGQTLKY